MKMTDQQLADLRQAAKLASSLPEINQEIDGMTRTTMQQAFGEIRMSTLTPEKAMSYLMELYSYHRLNKRFETKAALAATVTH